VIPPLDENGYLPVGVHECTLAEIREQFGSFRHSDRRPQLFRRLVEFLEELRLAHLASSLLIDGSFTTSNLQPNDIDLVLVLSAEHDLTADLSPIQYNLLSKRRVQRRFGFDIVAVRDGTLELDEAIAFFAQIRGEPERRKGILKVVI
jgi:hypothetical protein